VTAIACPNNQETFCTRGRPFESRASIRGISGMYLQTALRGHPGLFSIHSWSRHCDHVPERFLDTSVLHVHGPHNNRVQVHEIHLLWLGHVPHDGVYELRLVILIRLIIPLIIPRTPCYTSPHT
jgi:hypothetical protein